MKQSALVQALREAWNDSNPGVSGGHEEGGFIVRDASGQWQVLRWPKGSGNSIIVPPHSGCMILGSEIIATFHTHPNTGSNYLQEPSETDRRAVRDDSDFKASFYQGELVVAQATVYLVSSVGLVSELGETTKILAPT